MKKRTCVPSSILRIHTYSGARIDMIKIQHFSLNTILLLVVGLWPYQQTKLDRLRFIFLLTIVTTAIFFQFAAFLTSKCTAELVVKILSTALFLTIFVIKYICFAANIESVKDLLKQLQSIYNDIKDENENAIIKKYDYKARRCTTIFIILGICCIVIFTVVQVWSSILDIVSPINISRADQLPIVTEYFIDQKRYLFLILLHISVAFGTGMTVMIATGTMLIAYLQHTCGMFKISSYRIERAMRTNILKNINLKKENLILEEIVCGVKMHRQAMKLSEKLVSDFELMLFCLIVVGVISLSLNLFRISQIASSGINAKEFSLSFIFIAISIVYMFSANNTGQDVMNHNNDVFVTVYNAQWYATPLRIQNLILFLLQRGVKDFTLSVGGLFIGSLECFATLLKASISYFTVIYSTGS